LLLRYPIKCTRPVSGITFTRNAQTKRIEKQNNLKVFGSKTTKIHKIRVITKLPNNLTKRKSKLIMKMPVPSQGHYGFHSFLVVD
jgi:hypothetical protein